MLKKMKKNGGFTLVEMLIVVAIIAILVMVSIPVVSSSLDKARKATDDANVRAAKAEAVIYYLTEVDDYSNGKVYKYDAQNGKLVDANASVEGYCQYKENGTVGTSYVQVTIESDGDVKTEWK